MSKLFSIKREKEMKEKIRNTGVQILSPAPDVIIPEIRAVVPPRELKHLKRLMWRNSRRF